MDKILLSLSVPSVAKELDVFIPEFLPIDEILQLIISAVCEMTDNRYVISGTEVLCWRERNIVLQGKATLNQYGVKNGDQIILF